MRTVLDTNAYSAMRRGDRSVHEAIAESEEVLASFVVVGELLSGFRGGSRYDRNARDLSEFLSEPTVRLLPVQLDTADWFGRIADQLKRQGTPIPTNDVWIAAHAMEHGAEVLTFDRHFSHISGLALRLLSAG